MGEVCLDDGNHGEMAFPARPTDENRAIRKLRRNTIPMTALLGYLRHEFESYLGNVGLNSC
jgi:hypothetical protein